MERFSFGPATGMSAMGVGLPGDVRRAAVLTAFPLLLFTYLPRPPISGAQFLAYPALAGSLTVLILFLFAYWCWLDTRLWRILLLFLMANTVMAGSYLLNAAVLRTTGAIELFRHVLFALFLLYGYVVGRSSPASAISRGLLLGASGILVGQAFFSVFQVLGIPLFDLIYTGEKSRPLGSLVRVTGSLGNPNLVAWIVSQAGVIGLMLSRGRARYLYLAASAFLIVLSGSRTVLLVFPFMLIVASMVGRKNSGISWIRYAWLAAGVMAVFAVIVITLGKYLPYLAQLKLIFTTGSIASINSLNIRLIMWDEVFRQFSVVGWQTWLLGLGSRSSTAVLDNDYLYVLFRLGVVGFIVHLLLYAQTLRELWRARHHPAAMIGIEYLVVSLVVGLVSETLGGWNYPLFLFLFLGLAIGATATDSGRSVSVQGGSSRYVASEVPGRMA